MTAACGGGTSGPRTGVNSPFVIDPGAALNILSFAGGLGWSLFVGAIDTFLWDPSTDCANDPPGYQTLTLAEAMALVPMNSGSPDFPTAIQKLKDNIITALWWQNCQCTSGTAANQPAIPPLPSGAPQPANTANGTCSDRTWQGTPPLVSTGGTWPAGSLDIAPIVLPGATTGVSVQVVGGTRGNVTLYPLPPVKPTSIRTLLKVPSTNTHFIETTMWFGNTTCAVSQAASSLFVSPTTKFSYDSGVITVPATFTCGTTQNVTHWGYTIDAANDTLDHLTGPATTEVMVFGCQQIGPQCCDEKTSAPVVNVDTTALLNAISQMNDLVTLIQRQAVPFAYNLGSTHSSLTGSGEISVADLLGIKVIPASIPASAGVEVGDPDSLWLDSWIRWGNPDGWTQREFLTSAPFVSLPSVAGQYTRVGYTLRPGLAVDIVELVREP